MKPWKPAPLPDGSYADDTKPFSDQDVVNLIPTFAETRGARSSHILRPLPGLEDFADVGTGPHRGARNVEGRYFCVSGTGAYQVFQDGSFTLLGTVPGTGRVSISHNQITNGNEVKFVNGTAGYIYDTTDASFTRITDEGYAGEIITDYIASQFVGIEQQRRFFQVSELADGASYNTTNRFEGEASPDRMMSLIVAHSELIILNESTVECFDYTGTLNALFENKRITMMSGCAATHGVLALDNTILWPDNIGNIVRRESFIPVPISTKAIAQDLARCNLSKMFAFTWEDRGYKVAYWNCPDGHTWGWDATTGKWHRRESYGMDRWRANTLTKWNGAYYAGDFRDGRLYKLVWGHMLEGCDNYERYFTTPVLHDDGNRVTLDGLRLDIDSGGVPSYCGPTLTAPAFADTCDDASYSAVLTISDGLAPYANARVIKGDAPAGTTLTIDGTDLTVAFTNATAGAYDFWIVVDDDRGNTSVPVEVAFTVTTFTITGDLPDAVAATAYDEFVTLSGGFADYTVDITSGALPTGGATSVSGSELHFTWPDTVTAATYTFGGTVTDSEGCVATFSYSVVVADAGVACGIASEFDGGQAFPNTVLVTLGSATGDVTLTYATGPNPDKFEVWVGGVKVLDTGYHGTGAYTYLGGPDTMQDALSDYLAAHSLPDETIVEKPGADANADAQWNGVTNRETATFTKSTADTTALVKIYSPLTGTAWHFLLSCPA